MQEAMAEQVNPYEWKTVERKVPWGGGADAGGWHQAVVTVCSGHAVKGDGPGEIGGPRK